MLVDAFVENMRLGLEGVVDTESFLNWVYEESGLVLERMTIAQIADAVCDYEDREDPDSSVNPEGWGE